MSRFPLMKSYASDRVYEVIRSRILSGIYPPGHSLMSEKLAGEIGTSRSPVREALRQLALDGVVQIHPRSGVNVRNVDTSEFIELCDTRLALEGHAALLAAGRRNAFELAGMKIAMSQMRTLVERMAEAGEDEAQLNELEMADARFHIGIVSAAHNKLIKKEILRLHLISRVIGGFGGSAGRRIAQDKGVRDSQRACAIKFHEAIYEAIERMDGIAAKAAMENHIRDVISTRVMARSANCGEAAAVS